MVENNIKSVTFPATDVAGEAKLKRLIETIADYMGAKVTIGTVIVLQASYPADRADIQAILNRLKGSKTGLNQVVLSNKKKEAETVTEK